MAGLKKAGANWVDGDRFFDRDAELDVLEARVVNGTHTLLTAQRRMGKTSLIRELLRRVLEHDGYLEPWRDDEYRFVSGLLEDWWLARHGRHFVPIARRSGSHGA